MTERMRVVTDDSASELGARPEETDSCVASLRRPMIWPMSVRAFSVGGKRVGRAVVGGGEAAIGGHGVVELLAQVGEAPARAHFREHLGGTAGIVAAGLVDAVDDGIFLAVAEHVERVECGTTRLLGCPERDVVASLAHRLFEACQARFERCWQRLPWSAVAAVGRAQGAKDRNRGRSA